MKYTPVTGEDEKLFAAKISDIVRRCRRDGEIQFSHFLNLREQEIARQTAGALCSDEKTGFYGGFQNAERVMMCVCPSWDEPDIGKYPITALDFAVYGEFDHRDVLGSILALGISREPVGDILVADGGFRVYAEEKTAAFLRSELRRVGRNAAKCVDRLPDADFEAKFEQKSGTVASLRLDCVVSELINRPRDEVSQLIERGYVSVNHLEVTKQTIAVEPGDVISVRGHGKFRIDDAGRKSKKGRTILEYSVYK